MKKTLLATALVALSAFAANAQDTVRIATEGLYPPYNLIDDAGNLAGYEVDLGNEICKRAGLTCEFVQNDWDSMMPNLNSGNFDVIMAGMSITEDRKADRLFTRYHRALDVLDDKFDVVTTWGSGVGEFSEGYTSGNIRSMVDKGMLDMEDVVQVWQSPLIPNGPLVMRTSLPQEMKDKIIAFYTNQTINWGMAAALSAVLLAATLLLYMVYARYLGPTRVKYMKAR